MKGKYKWSAALFCMQVCACIFNVYLRKYPGTALMVLVISLAWAAFVIIDFRRVRRGDEELFDEVYPSIVRIHLVTFMLSQLFITLLSYGVVSNRNLVLFIAGMFMIAMGNVSPKVPYRSFMGFYVSWALKSSEVWRKVNRFAGILYIFGGICYIALSFVEVQSAGLYAYRSLILAVPFAMLVPVLWYSFRRSRTVHR